MAFLLPGAKLATKVDVNNAIYKSVLATSGAHTASQLLPATAAFQQLRAPVTEPPTTTVNRQHLLTYLRALDYLLDHKLPAKLPVQFLWVNAFDPDAQCLSNDINIDKVAVVFNLAVCEACLAQNAYRLRRTDPSSMKTAARHFQTAAGYFGMAASLPVPGGIRNVTTDLYPPALNALQMIMLGNAQQVFYSIAYEAATPPSMLARFAIGARDFYSIAYESLQDPDLANSSIAACMATPSKLLVTYYDAVAHSCQAEAHARAYQMSEQLTQIAHANKLAALALEQVKALDVASLASVVKFREQLLEHAHRLYNDIVQRQQDAEEENRKIYFQSPAASITVIQGRQSVKSADVHSVIAQQTVDPRLKPFEDCLRPLSGERSGFISMYTDMVAHQLASVVAALNTSAADLRDLMKRSEDAVHNSRANALTVAQHTSSVSDESRKSDQNAVDLVKNAQEKGGMTTIRELQVQVVNMASDVRTQVQKIESLLAAEDEEDRRLRASYPAVQRASSAELTHAYRTKLAKMQADLRQAANADAIVNKLIDKHGQSITDVERVQVRGLDALDPSIYATESANLSARVESIASKMKEEHVTGKGLLARKDNLVEAIETKKALEEPNKILLAIPEEELNVERVEEVVQDEYGFLKDDAQTLRADMLHVCDSLTDIISKLQQRPHADRIRMQAEERMKEVYRVQPAAVKFKEIGDHLEQGARFYAKEQDFLAKLLQEINDFSAARRAEADDLRRQYQSGMASHQGYYPSSSNPYSHGVPHYTTPSYPGNTNSAQSHPYKRHQSPYP